MNKPSRSQVAGTLLAAVTLAAVIGGLVMLGSPAEERARRLDERRVQDLTDIAVAVDLYWSRHARLPSSLDEVRQEPAGVVAFSDPITSAVYEYRPLQGERFELCARFDRPSQEPGVPTRNAFWSHAAGRQCFQRETRRIE